MIAATSAPIWQAFEADFSENPRTKAGLAVEVVVPNETDFRNVGVWCSGCTVSNFVPTGMTQTRRAETLEFLSITPTTSPGTIVAYFPIAEDTPGIHTYGYVPPAQNPWVTSSGRMGIGGRLVPDQFGNQLTFSSMELSEATLGQMGMGLEGEGVVIVRISTDNSSSLPSGDLTQVENANFLDRVYALEQARESRHAIEQIIDYLDDLLLESRFPACNLVLRHVDVSRLSQGSMVTFLGITRGAKEKLPARQRLYDRIKEVIAQDPARGPAGAARLLEKYR